MNKAIFPDESPENDFKWAAARAKAEKHSRVVEHTGCGPVDPNVRPSRLPYGPVTDPAEVARYELYAAFARK